MNNVAANRYPQYSGGTPPIIYFDSRYYEHQAPILGGQGAQPNPFNSGASPLFADAGVVAPYWHDKNNNYATNLQEDFNSQESWANPDTFQLIASGADNKYGLNVSLPMSAHLYPTGTSWDLNTESDNASNFTSKARIGDDLP